MATPETPERQRDAIITRHFNPEGDGMLVDLSQPHDALAIVGSLSETLPNWRYSTEDKGRTRRTHDFTHDSSDGSKTNLRIDTYAGQVIAVSVGPTKVETGDAVLVDVDTFTLSHPTHLLIKGFNSQVLFTHGPVGIVNRSIEVTNEGDSRARNTNPGVGT